MSVEIKRFQLKSVLLVYFLFFIPLTEIFLSIILKKAVRICLPHRTLKCVFVCCVERRVMLFSLQTEGQTLWSKHTTCNLICSIRMAHFVDPACVRYVCDEWSLFVSLSQNGCRFDRRVLIRYDIQTESDRLVSVICLCDAHWILFSSLASSSDALIYSMCALCFEYSGEFFFRWNYRHFYKSETANNVLVLKAKKYWIETEKKKMWRIH